MSSIRFLGTGGARFVVARQLRASGGIWLELEGANIIIDPGPGSLVSCARQQPKLDPSSLDGIILTHRHLDHSTDINVMIEAMTKGGFTRRGIVLVPSDALDEDPVVLKYVRGFPQELLVLKESGNYHIGDVEISTPIRHIHSSETYGLNIKKGGISLSFISDTSYFDGLLECYKGDILVINLVMLNPKKTLKHISVSDAKRIISHIKPRMAIITHFGTTMIDAGPDKVADKLQKETGVRVVAAEDGMRIDL
ncbi:MAG: MBL fold metallo-hydrolase [bacterium]